MVQSRFNHFTLISVWALALCAPTFMHGMQADHVDEHDAEHPAIVAAHVDPEAGNCTICQAIMTANEQTRHLICGHTFHAACINGWFANHHTTCPTCRENVVNAEGQDLALVAAYVPVAPAPLAPGVGIMARLRHVGAHAQYYWQTITPQPVRDVLGFALDISAMTAADRGPELVAQAIIRRQNAAKSASDEVQKIEAQTQTEASTPPVVDPNTPTIPVAPTVTTTRRPTVAEEVLDEYRHARSYTQSWWLPVADMFGVSRPASRATLALYLNQEVLNQRTSVARIAALNACLASEFVVTPLATDAQERAFRLLNPLFNRAQPGILAQVLHEVGAGHPAVEHLAQQLQELPLNLTDMLHRWSAEYLVVVATRLAAILSRHHA